MKLKLILTIALTTILLLFVISPIVTADSNPAFSNRPWTDDRGWCLGDSGNTFAAMRFIIPAGDDYVLNAVTVKLLSWHQSGAPAQMTLHDDAKGMTEPGDILATLGTLPLGPYNSYLEYTFPGGNNILLADHAYWLRVSVLATATCNAEWDFGDVPTGIFSYSTTVQVSNFHILAGDTPVDIEVDAEIFSAPPPQAPAPSFTVPHLSMVRIDASAPVQPYGSPGLEMQNFMLPADFGGKGYDVYIVTDVQLYEGEYWLGLFVGGQNWVYVPASSVVPLMAIEELE